jgi:hypothetical protein
VRLVRFVALFAVLPLAAAGHQGRVTFAGLPVPGATVSATGEAQKFTAITDAAGVYSFPELPRGTWVVEVEMTGFAAQKREIMVGNESQPAVFELRMLRLEELPAPTPQPRAMMPQPSQSSKAPPARASEAFEGLSPEELTQRAADGFLINGAANNAASSPFSLAPAFGNARRGRGPQYSGNLGIIFGDSALDARPFSLTGQDTRKPDFRRVQGVVSFGGPLRIPHLLRNGPNVTVHYQWTRNRNATTHSSRMPAAAERAGDFSANPQRIFDPASQLAFPNNSLPAARISPQAQALLSLYPPPNFASAARYNHQVALTGATHQDNLQSRFQQRANRTNQVWGNFAYQSTRTDHSNAFGFLTAAGNSGVNAGINWMHSFRPRLYAALGAQFSRLAAHSTPFFAGRRNVSAEAGITGNNQEPANWGPPALQFSSGIAGLSDALPSSIRNQTAGVSLDLGWNRGRHYFLYGGGYRRQQFNTLAQEDPRGTFTFTGAATSAVANGVPVPGTGLDFAGFLLGIPDTSAIAFGNADKYFRATAADLYLSDDWRVNPGLTLNLGLRWEYASPIREKFGRLVNLALTAGFASATPVVSERPLLPDGNNLAPRIGFAWRPFAAASMIVRGGYGVYYDSAVYQPIAAQMAQQSPLSTSLRVQNSSAHPLTLADGFRAPAATARNTFAVDPRFRIGYSQNWQLSLQRDLPFSLVMTALYQGIKGTRSQQQVLPNTWPLGAVNPCPACPAGFAYLASNGNSIRHAGQFELRRRLRAGFTATLQYTYAKAIDNAALSGRGQGGTLIAQNWLDLRSERARSNFDQRHLLSAQLQYTTGMGIAGGALLGGKKAALLRGWTASAQITAGSGLPLTPVFPAAVAGTGVTSSIRPDYTGAPLYDAPGGLFLNPAAFAAPAAGRWGNAGRNSITGPSQFTLDASLSRAFRVSDRWNLDLRIDAANALNHPVFPAWNTTVTSVQFGLPATANPMRSVQTTLRLRF